MTPFDPAERARSYQSRIPQLAVEVPEPWWWAVLGLDCGVINVPTLDGLSFKTPATVGELDAFGTIAVIATGQNVRDRNEDVKTIAAVLRAEGKISDLHATYMDGYPQARDKVVGLATVTGTMDDDTAEGLWFVGPYALRVTEPVVFPPAARAAVPPVRGISPFYVLDPRQRERIGECLSYMQFHR